MTPSPEPLELDESQSGSGLNSPDKRKASVRQADGTRRIQKWRRMIGDDSKSEVNQQKTGRISIQPALFDAREDISTELDQF
ncbi:hypothetical protein [Bacillus coreaensis]